MHGELRSNIFWPRLLTAELQHSPGRFFAVNMIKVMMAHVVLTYDIMMSELPQIQWFGLARIPDNSAEVLFRKRRV